MIQDKDNLQHYLAEEGKVIVLKKRDEDFFTTKSIWIGGHDSIDNYEEIDEPQENNE